MIIEQCRWTTGKGWLPKIPGDLKKTPQLVLVFGATSVLKEGHPLNQLKRIYPSAHFFGCSTAGEICGTQVFDDSLVMTAVYFEQSRIKTTQIKLRRTENSLQAGENLAQSLDQEELKHVLLLSDGLKVNGSDLVGGILKWLPKGVTVTGGLSGDGERFKETLVLWEGSPQRDTIAVLGLYGNRLKVGYGSLGGWDSFGQERLITKSRGNVLYELDRQSALGLYKKYLGEQSTGLPATGLFYPLSLRMKEGENSVVRTILAVNEKEQSVTFAGDVPEGSYARLMKANFDRLIDGAVGAAKTSYQAIGAGSPDLALLISCVGRKMVLNQRIEEEVEGVRDIMGDQTALTGFYSYGEVSPFTPGAKCELHNQTMTITTLSEK